MKNFAIALMLAAAMGAEIRTEPQYDLSMRKRDKNKSAPSKEVREKRKRQKKARKQNR